MLTERGAMPCYLCAYQLSNTPESRKDLPDNAPAWSWYALGTCCICNVWACALHGTRYGQFECAICTPAVATQHALGIADPPPDGRSDAAASTALAYEAGVNVSDTVQATVKAALEDIAGQERRDVSRSEDLSLARPRSGDPDLLLNYAEVIRARTGEHGDFLPGVQPEWRESRKSMADGAPQPPGPPDSAVSIDAVGATVRHAFAGRSIEVTDDGVVIVTGALLLSMAVANRPRPRPADPELMDAVPEVGLPWEITHPVLLDPVMWVIATAYGDRR
jgi:hypothetical protein